MSTEDYIATIAGWGLYWLLFALPLLVAVGFVVIRRQTPNKAAFVFFASVVSYGICGCILLIWLLFQLANVALAAQLYADGYESLSFLINRVATVLGWIAFGLATVVAFVVPPYIGLSKWPEVWRPWQKKAAGLPG